MLLLQLHTRSKRMTFYFQDTFISFRAGKQVSYIVVASGGYWHLQWRQQGVTEMSLLEKVSDRDDVVFEKYCDDHHSFMRIQVETAG
jgi:hypothetical protein